MGAVTLQITGFDELIRNLSTLGPRVYNRAVVAGLAKGAKHVVKGARSLCRKRMTARRRGNRKLAQNRATLGNYAMFAPQRERTGALEKSIGVRMTKNTKRLIASAVIGPRAGFAIAYDKKTGNTLAGSGKLFRSNKARFKVMHDPAKIAHLVELGHGGPRPAPPHPFMRPAFDSGKYDIIRGLEGEMRSAFEEEGREK